MDCVSSDDNSISEDNYYKSMDNLKNYLPFLKKIIDSQDLGIQEEHLNKLQNLYEMVELKRLAFIYIPSLFITLYDILKLEVWLCD